MTPSQLGTLLFGKAIAHNFDIHSKSWYFLSFVLLSTATGAYKAQRGLRGAAPGRRLGVCRPGGRCVSAPLLSLCIHPLRSPLHASGIPTLNTTPHDIHTHPIPTPTPTHTPLPHP